jgi:D-alanyl-D-alanine carboxypeptidase
MLDTSLDHLTPEFKPLAMELIARCIEARCPVVIVNTLRDAAQQQANIIAGVSWTSNSKHLPQPPSMLSDAIDLAPISQYVEHGSMKVNWDVNDPAWSIMGVAGMRLGLRWGAKFPKPDMGHFEYVRAKPVQTT